MSPVSLTAPILIIEDDRNTAALIATYLEKEGFATHQVHDGAEALSTARQQAPGFVILDVRTLSEFDDGHIPKALNIDFFNYSFESHLKTLDKGNIEMRHFLYLV